MPSRAEKRRRQRKLTVYSHEPDMADFDASEWPAKVDVLPDDLLVEIFEHTIIEDAEGERRPADIHVLISICRVSRRWKATAVSCAALWRFLYIHITPTSNPLNLYHVPFWLSRSGTLPLHLKLDMRLRDGKDCHMYHQWTNAYSALCIRRLSDLSDMLLPHVERITKLELHFGRIYREILSSSLDLAKNIQELSISSEDYHFNFPRMFPRGARPRKLKIINSELPPLPERSLCQLELGHINARVRYTFAGAMRWIDTTRLTHLCFHPSSVVMFWDWERFTPANPGREGAYKLPALQRLELDDFCEYQTIALFTQVSMPALQELVTKGMPTIRGLLEYLDRDLGVVYPMVHTLRLSAQYNPSMALLSVLFTAFPATKHIHTYDTISEEITLLLLVYYTTKQTQFATWQARLSDLKSKRSVSGLPIQTHSRYFDGMEAGVVETDNCIRCQRVH